MVEGMMNQSSLEVQVKTQACTQLHQAAELRGVYTRKCEMKDTLKVVQYNLKIQYNLKAAVDLLRALLNGSMPNMQTTGVPEGMTIADVMMAARGYNSAGEKLAGGGYLSGGGALGDGMSDDIPAMIGNNQPAALSEGEFVIPADVVSHLGNGSSNAGSKRLYAMMDQVRKDRTGTEKQGNQIDPRRYMPA
jgi:hypothetical protein